MRHRGALPLKKDALPLIDQHSYLCVLTVYDWNLPADLPGICMGRWGKMLSSNIKFAHNS